MSKQIEALVAGSKLSDVITKVNEMVAAHNAAQDRRGPKSSREMTDADARMVLPTGEHAALSHKDAAEKLGLSYAQVYSCRGQYTFKHIHKEVAEKLAKAKTVEPSDTESSAITNS